MKDTPIPTPRTDAEHAQFPMGGFTLDFARRLERELTAVTEQRDRLTEALERILDYQGRFAEEDPESIAKEALKSIAPNK